MSQSESGDHAPAFREVLRLQAGLDGKVWHHVNRGSTYVRHMHDELEVNVVTRGTANYLVGDRRYEMTRGVVLWLFPDQDHLLVNQSTDFSMWILVFRPEAVERIAATGGQYDQLRMRDPEGEFAREIPDLESGSLGSLYEALARQADDAPCFNAGLAYALAATWLAFLRSPEPGPAGSLHPGVEQVVRVLRDESVEETVPDLARIAGLSPSRLSRLFHAQVGIPISAFRNEQRLRRFEALMRARPTANLAHAALDAGFGSYAQFYRVYRSAHGRGPGRTGG
jgi:AraC-like DNA-binding protein